MNIILSEFLGPVKIHEINKPVIYFKGNNYSFLFFSLLFKKINIINNKSIKFIDIIDGELNSIKSHTEQTFLGTASFYWLGNISEFGDKKSKDMLEYLHVYQGPNILGAFINQDLINADINQYQDKYVIECDDIRDITQLKKFLILWPEASHKTILLFMQKALLKYNKLSLDQLCMLVNYSIVIGSKSNDFLENWADKILVPDYSLFQLSKFFFAKDAISFFKYWNLIEHDYAPVFWVSFWSEQIFRALNFIVLQKNGKNVEAKQMAFKLPFSFIQQDWKKISHIELHNAHQFIYLTDYNLKNGCSEILLDLFYAKFFTGNFKNV